MVGSITHIWKSKENMRKLVLSIHHVGSGYQTQVTHMPNTFPAEPSPQSATWLIRNESDFKAGLRHN